MVTDQVVQGSLCRDTGQKPSNLTVFIAHENWGKTDMKSQEHERMCIKSAKNPMAFLFVSTHLQGGFEMKLE